MLRRRILTVLLLLVSSGVLSQRVENCTAQVMLENMHSTHGTQFRGISGTFSKRLSSHFSLGAGVEYSHSPLHDDNGWELTKLNFFPVFVSEQFRFLPNKKLAPYLHLRQGISFISYYRERQANRGVVSHVREKGFYGYAGSGALYKFSRKWTANVEGGLKAFHISNNNLDINPHGITIGVGLIYHLSNTF